MSAPQAILELVERFERHHEAYRSIRYNETQVRREFIDPLFQELGWDIANRQGYAEPYKDVIHEDAIKVGGATKAPDYCFRMGGTRKFFLEAKRPAINLREDASPAFQLRRYAWSAKLPLSILTDFEELSVYDCRIQPVKTDHAATARLLYFTYPDYAQRWEDIANIFSREAILTGSFDAYADSMKRKKGTLEVDTAFLKEIESWRALLARHMALRNPQLTQRQLNYAVQTTIDWIIFLRICEDRGIEDYGQLLELQQISPVYGRLCELFQRADERYNSGLFHFQREQGRAELPDEVTPRLIVDDGPIRQIIKSLYYPDSPYEFSVLPADILGQVYEQFLGKVIRLTAGHHAVIEDKPEVRKAGGVYYTPTYIVHYIVQQTVGKLLEDCTLRQATKLKVLDPACGSGSFLIGAYQRLLDWYLDQYITAGPKRHRKVLYQGPSGHWRLTTAERKRILLNHIYGVDIDPQAVEVTKLSLLLKVLEGENQQTLMTQLRLFQERALPDLSQNIKCGNSLISPDIYDGHQIPLLSEDERYRVNVFDWQMEFQEILGSGGFDAVIGNPPWGAEFTALELAYHRQKNQEIIIRMIDSFMYFVYQGSKKLKAHGRFGMILPDVLLYQKDNAKLREFILKHFEISVSLNMGNVFEKVTRPASIIIFQQDIPAKHRMRTANLSDLSKLEKEARLVNELHFEHILQQSLSEIPSTLFITENLDQYNIWTKVNKVPHRTLEQCIDEDGIQRGASPDLKEAFLVDTKARQKYGLEKDKLRRVLTGGRQVKRYTIDYPDLWIIYMTQTDNIRELPHIKRFIDQFAHKTTCKEVLQNKHSLYSLHRPRKERIFLKDNKLLGVITEDTIKVALDDAHTFATDGLYIFAVKNDINVSYLMALLNSRLFVFIYRLLTLEEGRVLAQVKPTTLNQLPIRTINFAEPADKLCHDQIVARVSEMVALNQYLADGKTAHENMALQRQIHTVDRQIDQLVYQLYRLTAEEVNVVEHATQ
jgi:hypothetical protein